jgi:hypothetical protein
LAASVADGQVFALAGRRGAFFWTHGGSGDQVKSTLTLRAGSDFLGYHPKFAGPGQGVPRSAGLFRGATSGQAGAIRHFLQ